MLLVDNWEKVRVIKDSMSANIRKSFAWLLPNFDEVSFPFILVCGEMGYDILNVRDGFIKSLINQKQKNSYESLIHGSQTAFAKIEGDNMKIHLVSNVLDIDSFGRELI